MTGPLAILQIHGRFDGSAKDAQVVRLMNHWGSKARHDLLIAQPGADGARAGIDPAVAVRFLEGPAFGPEGGPARYVSLAQCMRDYDLVLSFGWGGFDGVVTQRLLGLLMGLPPLIHHEDGSDLDVTGPLGLSGDFYRRSSLSSVDALVVPTARMAHVAIERWHEATAHVHQIPHGVDVAAYGGTRLPSEIPGLADDGRLILGACVEDASAGMLDALLRAVAPLHKTVRLVLLDAAGEGAVLGARAKALGMNDLLVPETLPRPQDYLGALNLFVLLAKSDPAPRLLAEAMAAGLPVIASETGDAAEMLGTTGRKCLVSPGDEMALAATLDRLTKDAALRDRLGAANQRRAAQGFDEQVMFDLYARLYGGAVNRENVLL